LVLLVGSYAGLRAMGNSSPHASLGAPPKAAASPDPRTWAGAQVTFDANGAPVVSPVDEGDSAPQAAVCRAVAEGRVRAATLLDMATALPELKTRADRTDREYDAFARLHPASTLSPTDRARLERLRRTTRSTRDSFRRSVARFNRLVNKRNAVFDACMTDRRSN
jgi:hypothetical protein